jgi:anaerobic C4-dicarboxylate transporter
MAKKTKETPETAPLLTAFLPVKHRDGNVSIVSVQIPSDTPTKEEIRPCHPLVACDSLFGLVWDVIWVKR